MPNNALAGFLGIARGAGRLLYGHDPVISAIVTGRAQLCICARDASERLKNELRHACSYGDRDIPFFVLDEDMEFFRTFTGKRTGVVTVTDAGMANKILRMVQTSVDNE